MSDTALPPLTFLELPNELLSQIFASMNHLLLDKQDYLAISLVNKRLRDVVYPLFHREISIRLGGYDGNVTKSENFARGRLLAEPGLAAHVRDMRINCVHGRVEDGDVTALEILRATPNLQELHLGYYIGVRSVADPIFALLQSGFFNNLTLLDCSRSLCACQMPPLFAIPGLRDLRLGYYSDFEEERCTGDHGSLLQRRSSTLCSSSVRDVSISSWTGTNLLRMIINLPKVLVKFSGSWNPQGSRYSARAVTDFLLPHKDTLRILQLGASIDKEDEYDAQISDGSLASFADFTALRQLSCHVDIIIGEDFSGPNATALAERLPRQLEYLRIDSLPRIVSAHAHKAEVDMDSLDSNLVWLRSLARAKHENRSSLRHVAFNENAHLPGPLEGPFLHPKFLHTKWREEEKTAWIERGPYPFEAAGITLTAHLVFVVRGWTRLRRGAGEVPGNYTDEEA